MALDDDVQTEISSILEQPWDIRDGTVVPTTDSVAMAGGGVKLEATILYADLADSTELAMKYDRRIAARVFKCYLAMCSRIIRVHDGDIRSFDGDRVMAVFLGDTKNSNAGNCALKIGWAFWKYLKPKLNAKYAVLREGGYNLAQTVGIDTSDVLVVRAGIRLSNDLVWVGRAPNVAAKLSSIREPNYQSYCSLAVFNRFNEGTKHNADGALMWEERSWAAVPGVTTVYRSKWMRTP